MAQIRLFARARRRNQRQEVWERAVAVSLGIRDALGTDGKLLAAWLEQERTAGGDAGVTQPEPKSSISPRARAFFQGLPKKES